MTYVIKTGDLFDGEKSEQKERLDPQVETLKAKGIHGKVLGITWDEGGRSEAVVEEF